MKYGLYSHDFGNRFVLSVDNVIAEYNLRSGGGQRLLDWISDRLLWQHSLYECFGGVGKFKYQFTFDFGAESTVTLLIGFFGASGRIDPDKVRLDFNPNKVDCGELDSLIVWLKMNSLQDRIVRYDLAFDIPAKRTEVCLVRTDKRKRGFEELSAENYTEYLGRRNTPGRYKLYNKTIESKLDYDLVRSELTCSGEWTPQQVLSNFPAVYLLEPFASEAPKQYCSGIDLVVLSSIIECPWLSYKLDWLNFRKKKSLQNILAQCSANSNSVHAIITQDNIADILELLANAILTDPAL